MQATRLQGIPGLDTLFRAVLSLTNVDDCYRFFDDLCTVGELKAMAQRLSVAVMLIGGAKYEEIEHATGASSATISRVKRFVQYGSGGYRLARERLSPPAGRGAADRQGGAPA